MRSALILAAIVALTVVGDYSIKAASQLGGGLWTRAFLLGALMYGLPAVGWYYLMQAHSLAAIGVFYSAVTLLLLAGMGTLVFKESFGLREMVGLSLALASVVVMSVEN